MFDYEREGVRFRMTLPELQRARLHLKHLATRSRQSFVDYQVEEPERENAPGRMDDAQRATEAVYSVPEDRRTRRSVLRRFRASVELVKRFSEVKEKA